MRSEPHLVGVCGEKETGRQQVRVPVEAPLCLRVNGKLAATIMRQPGDDLELARGYCLTQGLIAEPSAMLTVRTCESDANTVEVITEGETADGSGRERRERGPDQEPPEASLPEPLELDRETVWRAADLFAMPPQFRNHQEQHQLSGGVHAAALFDREGRLVVLREDVGRYNAADKVVGYCAMQRSPTSDLLLMVSGRASSLMVLKAVRARLPVLATMSNTTSLGLELAERLGLTLVTYLRADGLRVCSHAFRIY